jgi:hypothetical protein
VPAPAPGGAATDTQMSGIIAAFETYFNGINSGDYTQAYAALTPAEQAKASEAAFAEGVSTSYDSDFQILGSTIVDDRVVDAGLAFTSIQESAKGPNGDTCDNWTLTYKMIQQADGTWLIDTAKPYNGSTHTTC